MYAFVLIATIAVVVVAALLFIQSDERAVVVAFALAVGFFIAEPLASLAVGDSIAPVGDSIRRLLGTA